MGYPKKWRHPALMADSANASLPFIKTLSAIKISIFRAIAVANPNFLKSPYVPGLPRGCRFFGERPAGFHFLVQNVRTQP